MSLSEADGLFTLGVAPESFRLPHPRLGLPVILLIRRVLLRAFDELRQKRFPFPTATEDEVTAALRGIIENNFRQTGSVSGFNRRTYESVVRQGQVSNYDFSRPTKTPDLCFKLRHDEAEPRFVVSEFDALFVECKPIDRNHAAGGKYCDEGLIRFVEGSYAWAMEEGLMIGYARHGRTIAGNLIPDMQVPRRHAALKTTKLATAVNARGAAATTQAEALHVSHHRRGFNWIAGKGAATGILVYHSWHDCG